MVAKLQARELSHDTLKVTKRTKSDFAQFAYMYFGSTFDPTHINYMYWATISINLWKISLIVLSSIVNNEKPRKQLATPRRFGAVRHNMKVMVALP